MVEEKKKEKEQRRKIDQKNVTQNVRISKTLSITALILNFNSLIKVTAMTVLQMTPNIISSSKNILWWQRHTQILNERKASNVPSKWKPKPNKRHFTYIIDFMLILFRINKTNT